MAFTIAPLSFTRRTFIAATSLAATGAPSFAHDGTFEAVTSPDRPNVRLLTGRADGTGPIHRALSSIAASGDAAVLHHHAPDLEAAARALPLLARQGDGLIVLDAPGLAAMAAPLALRHPNAALLVNVASDDEEPRFEFHARGRNYRTLYRRGSLIALRPPSGKIGLLGRFAVPETLNLFQGFCEGACSRGRSPVFDVEFSNSIDPTGAALASAIRSLVDRGADVVLAPADVPAPMAADRPGPKLVRYEDPLLLADATDSDPGALWQLAPMLRRIVSLTSPRRAVA